MSPRTYVDSGFTTLNTRADPSALGDGQMQVAQNVSHATDGALRPSAYSPHIGDGMPAIDPHGFAAVRLQATDYILLNDETKFMSYDIAADTIATIKTGLPATSHNYIGDGTRAYCLNGSSNFVYNPDHASGRVLGPPAMAETTGTMATGSDVLVVSASAGSPTYLELVASGDHGMIDGEQIYLSGFTGDWTDVNDKSWEVTRYSATQVSIDFDSTGFGSIGGAATYRKWPANIVGNYKWKASVKITHASGDIIETDALPVRVSNNVTGDVATTEFVAVTADMVLTMTVATLSTLTILVSEYGSLDDITAVGRLWRTKTNGVDFQLVGEKAIAVGGAPFVIHDSVLDGDLGEIWLDKEGDHTRPPTGARLAVVCQQRMFYATLADNKLWFSKLNQYEYVPPLNYVTLPDWIVSMAVLQDKVAVVTPSGWSLYSPVDELGQLTNVQNVLGTTRGQSLVETEYGILFCRDDGLYLFDGAHTTRISETIDNTWTAGNWRGAHTPGFAFFTNDNLNVEMAKVGDEFRFSVDTGLAWWYLSASPDRTKIYAVMGSAVGTGYYPVVLHGSETEFNALTATTRKMGKGRPEQGYRLIADYAGLAHFTVYSNRGQISTGHGGAHETRRTRREMLPATMIGEWFWIKAEINNQLPNKEDGMLYAIGIEVV